MASFVKKLWSPAAFDTVFAVAGLFSVWGLYRLATLPVPPLLLSDRPLLKAAVATGVMIAGSLIATFTTRIDQRIADDFTFQTLTKSAMMGLMGFFMASMAWYSFAVKSFGALSSFSMVILALGCWSVCYFIVRLRGTGA